MCVCVFLPSFNMPCVFTHTLPAGVGVTSYSPLIDDITHNACNWSLFLYPHNHPHDVEVVWIVLEWGNPSIKTVQRRLYLLILYTISLFGS